MTLSRFKKMYDKIRPGAKLTQFNPVEDFREGALLNEEELPWAIVIEGVHSPEIVKHPASSSTAIDWGPPTPVILALSFLVALMLFFSAE